VSLVVPRSVIPESSKYCGSTVDSTFAGILPSKYAVLTGYSVLPEKDPPASLLCGAFCGHAALVRLDREHIWNTKHRWVVVTDVMPHNVVFWVRDARDPDCDEYVVIKRSLNRDVNTR